MSKAILMLLLAMVSSSAMARWVEITEGEKMTVSFDPAAVRKNGNLVQISNGPGSN